MACAPTRWRNASQNGKARGGSRFRAGRYRGPLRHPQCRAARSLPTAPKISCEGEQRVPAPLAQRRTLQERNLDSPSQASRRPCSTRATRHGRRRRPAHRSDRRHRRVRSALRIAQDGKSATSRRRKCQRHESCAPRDRHPERPCRAGAPARHSQKPAMPPIRIVPSCATEEVLNRIIKTATQAIEARCRSGHRVRAIPHTACATIATATSFSPCNTPAADRTAECAAP
jgi:hypothetical protein